MKGGPYALAVRSGSAAFGRNMRRREGFHRRRDGVVPQLVHRQRLHLAEFGPCREGRRKSGSQRTRCWREQDSNPRSPGRETRSRYGEREPGKGHGGDKRRSQIIREAAGIKRPEPLLCGDRRFRWLRIELAQARHDLLCEQRDVGDRVLMVQEAALTKEQEMAEKDSAAAPRLRDPGPFMQRAGAS
jgi:hypothetical protein